MTAAVAIPAVRSSVASLVRACAAHAIAATERTKTPPVKIATRNWSHDSGAIYLTQRAAVPPTDTSTTPALLRTIMPDFVATLSPDSAAAKIFKEGLQLSFDGAAQIAVPTLLADPSYASFVKEGNPIPVPQGFVEPLVVLVPHKLAAIMVMTSEMVRSSNVEMLLRDALVRSAALALDAVMFDASPGDASRPPGLRYNINPLSASSAPDPVTALLDDIETLHVNVATVTPENPIYVMSPTRAVMAQLRSPHNLDPLIVHGTFALSGTRDILAVAPHVVVSAYGEIPEIEASYHAALHLDTAPSQISDSGSIAAPVRSLWQSDCVAIKVELPVTWGLRAEPGLAWLTAVNW